jgi:hypothetical protein
MILLYSAGLSGAKVYILAPQVSLSVWSLHGHTEQHHPYPRLPRVII